MAKIQIIDSVLPFTCSNPDCEKEYDLELFTEVMLLWGYIYLISEDDRFEIVGLTCPSCLQTTIRKYSADEALLFNSKLKRQSKLELNQYIHFSYFLLKQWNIIDIEYTRDEEDHPCFFLPQDTTQIHNTVDQQFGATEGDLSFLCSIENEHGLKAIPRIVPYRSIYLIFEMIFQDKTLFDLNETLVALIKPNSDKNIDNLSVKFSHMVSNNLTEEKYKKMDLDLLSSERKSFKENVQGFLNDAKLIRNKIDYEIIYRDELINIYAEKMYYDPAVVRMKEFESMEMLEEGLVGEDFTLSSPSPAGDMESLPNHRSKTFKKANSLVSKTNQPIKLLAGDKLMKRWNLDGFGVVNLVLVHKVAATDILGRTPLTDEILAQRDFVELLSGDEADQKRALRRLRFDPNDVYDFENGNVKLFEELGVRLKKSTDEVKLKKVSKLRPSQKHRLAVREVAEKLWKKSPNMRIEAMINEDEINNIYLHERDELYTEKTLRKWICDLCPNPRTGRPKKDENSS